MRSFLRYFTWYILITSAQTKHCDSFVRGSHLLPSQLPGEHTGHEAASRHGEPIWNAHYSSTHHHCQVPILHLGEVRHTWSSHLAKGSYIVSQLAALRFEPLTCIFRVPCTIHLATMFPWYLHVKHIFSANSSIFFIGQLLVILVLVYIASRSCYQA